MTTIYRQRPLQPWTNRVLRQSVPVRVETLYVPPELPVWDGVAKRTVFNPRATAHLGSQQAPAVVLTRLAHSDVTLPRRQNASPIPLGSNGQVGLNIYYALIDGTYGNGLYGSGSYGDE